MKIQLSSLTSRAGFEEYVDMYKMRELTDYPFIPSARLKAKMMRKVYVRRGLSHVMGLRGI